MFLLKRGEKVVGRAKRSNMVALRACTMAMLHGQSEKRDTGTIYHVPHGPCRTFSSFLFPSYIYRYYLFVLWDHIERFEAENFIASLVKIGWHFFHNNLEKIFL